MSRKGAIIIQTLVLVLLLRHGYHASCKLALQIDGDSPIGAQEERSRLIRIDLFESNEFELDTNLRHLKGQTGTTRYHVVDPKFIGEVGIGNPRQEFKLFFDSASSNLWVPTLTCQSCGDKTRYNSSASRTFVKDGARVQFGSYYGFRSIDRVTLGDLVIENQTFSEMALIDVDLNLKPYDGVFCLGLDVMAEGQVVTPLRRMLNEGLIDQEVVSIYRSLDRKGQIVFGGIDSNHYKGQIVYTPNVIPWTWAVKIQGVALKGASVCQTGCTAAIRTSSSFVSGPPDQIAALNKAIGAEPDKHDNTTMVISECNISELSSLKFTVEGQVLSLAPEHYTRRAARDGKLVCVSLLRPVVFSIPDWWILGAPFIGNIYTVLDQSNNHSRVGFAQTVQTNQVSHPW